MSVDDLDVHDMDMLNMVMHNVRARREHAGCWRSCHWHHKAILSSAINKMTTLKDQFFLLHCISLKNLMQMTD